MKKTILLGALALLMSPTTAWAFPMCDGPAFDRLNSDGTPRYDEAELAAEGERELRAQGIDANQTRFWNGCLQTFVDDGSGHQTMKFYDPDTLREVR